MFHHQFSVITSVHSLRNGFWIANSRLHLGFSWKPAPFRVVTLLPFGLMDRLLCFFFLLAQTILFSPHCSWMLHNDGPCQSRVMDIILDLVTVYGGGFLRSCIPRPSPHRYRALIQHTMARIRHLTIQTLLETFAENCFKQVHFSGCWRRECYNLCK